MDDLHIHNGEIVGGPQDGKPAVVLDFATFPLVVIVDPEGTVTVRGCMSQQQAINALRTFATRMEQDLVDGSLHGEYPHNG